MKKIIILAILTLTITGYSQNKQALKLYYQGLSAFNNNDLKTADSLFTLSASLEPNKDTYFNLATTKIKLGDFCGFCYNLNKASEYHDYEAGSFYYKKCNKFDTVYRKINKEKGIYYFCLSATEICTKNKTFQFFKMELGSGQQSFATEMGIDYRNFKEADLTSPEFDIEKLPDTVIVHTICDEMPSYNGGDEARQKYLKQNIVYPEIAKKYGISGTVYLKFIINTKGKVTNVKVVKGIGAGCDEEAIRVVRSLPDWNPGKDKGRPVNVEFNMPVRFSLD